MSKLPGLFEATWIPPDDHLHRDIGDLDQYYRPWGFTIYRTSYEPAEASDTHWQALLAKIKSQVATELDSHTESGDENMTSRLKISFFLNHQSDPVLLGGKSAPELRVLHLGRQQEGRVKPGGGEGYLPSPPTWPGSGLFLLADAEVLESPNRYSYPWVKCVIANHDVELARNPPKNNRMPNAAPDGWFRMTTSSIVELCMDLQDCDWKTLPPVAPQNSEMYEGERTW